MSILGRNKMSDLPKRALILWNSSFFPLTSIIAIERRTVKLQWKRRLARCYGDLEVSKEQAAFKEFDCTLLQIRENWKTFSKCSRVQCLSEHYLPLVVKEQTQEACLEHKQLEYQMY